MLAAAILILPALATDSNISSFSFTSSESISGTGFVSTYERMNANFSIFKSDRSLDSRETSHGSGEYRSETSIEASDTIKKNFLEKTTETETEMIYIANFDENATMNLQTVMLSFGHNRSIELLSPWGESRTIRNDRQDIALGESFFVTSALQLDRSESLYWRKKGSAEDYKLTSSLDANFTGRGHLVAVKSEPATSTGDPSSWTIEETADYSGSHQLSREISYSEKIASTSTIVEYKTKKSSQGEGFISTSDKLASKPDGIEALEESEKIHGSGEYLQESSSSMYEKNKWTAHVRKEKVARLEKTENLEAIYSATELPPTGSLKAGPVKSKWSDTTRARVNNTSYKQSFSDAIVIEKESTLSLSWENYTDYDDLPEEKEEEERSFFKSDLNATLVGSAHLGMTSGDYPRDEDILMDQDYEGTFDISSEIMLERTYINRTDKPDWLICGCPAHFDVSTTDWLGCCPKGRLDWTDPDWMAQQPFNCSCPTGIKA